MTVPMNEVTRKEEKGTGEVEGKNSNIPTLRPLPDLISPAFNSSPKLPMH